MSLPPEDNFERVYNFYIGAVAANAYDPETGVFNISPTGPQGPTGPTGPTGKTGPTGPTGA